MPAKVEIIGPNDVRVTKYVELEAEDGSKVNVVDPAHAKHYGTQGMHKQRTSLQAELTALQATTAELEMAKIAKNIAEVEDGLAIMDKVEAALIEAGS